MAGRKGHSAAMMFLGYSDEINTARRSVGDRGFNASRTIAGQNPEDTIELNEKNEKNEKNENMKIERKSEEIRTRVNPIATEPPNEKLGTPTVSEESPKITTGKLEFHFVPI